MYKRQAVTSRTRAIIPVHLYGAPADVDAVLTVARAHHLLVIEDCAQAHGARYRGQRVGTLGDAAAFSFYPTKNLGALGDGGAVATNRPEVAERLRLLRQYGWRERYVSDVAGYNSCLLYTSGVAPGCMAVRQHDSTRPRPVRPSASSSVPGLYRRMCALAEAYQGGAAECGDE